MKVIGLTGGIAAGKTTVAACLRRLGAAVIDADVVAREVVEPGKPAWRDIQRVFGPSVFRPDGDLDRAALGRIVFADGEARARLNGIVHPQVIERFEQEMARLARQGAKVVVLDVPLLFEAGMEAMAGEIWVVAVDEVTQVRRLMERDNLDEAAARARIFAQMPLAEKIKRADRLIDAGQPLPEMKKQVEQLWKEAAGEVE
ncbi:dephospho-CoA kinase [Heliobacterium gestii]|uniref:Dephospho-CoA kinase n=1 Tax=Heliomicrobium gestii TaxID=2699 RepID=A0A845LAB2_HELGE|nr:dephospho-CoA kinase [Heliomicrobium gestii]MBM7866152.1 dephospho-CoA kinase [Heliomicrobium gestii]MZP42521.1 dephospho-CoA kinase [Heliomicrobium gestii]